ncbi:MAG: type II secretion system F family protein [Patescibacteria group bacterium]|nr:type II secretion system F family protein [Patescibacteria group bacterium]MDE1966540.1 type II secretion system F family protein [Patescibacteria group bacterium]
MSHFIYKAKHQNGETYSGEKEAADRYELYKLLHDSGDELISLTEKKRAGGIHLNMKIGSFGSGVKTDLKIQFARNLGSMIEAGLPLSRALGVLERQSGNKNLKGVIKDLIADVDKGSTFSDALAKHPKIFAPLFVSMVHAGEQSGGLADALKVIANQMDNSYALTKRVRGALIYPCVIITAMVIIAILMLVFVIPVLLKTFTDMGVELPLPTRIVLFVADLVQHDGILLALVLIVLAGAFVYWSKKPKGKIVNHLLLLKIPVIGGLVQEVNSARTARTLSSLLSSGVDVVESVNITAGVVQNVHFKAILQKAGQAIGKGELMSKIFSQNEKLYPPFFSEMISVGEETGKTADMLLGVAKYYEDDVDQKTKNMSTIIEPVLMIIIGSAVGFFAVSMIEPMYSLVNAIH